MFSFYYRKQNLRIFVHTDFFFFNESSTSPKPELQLAARLALAHTRCAADSCLQCGAAQLTQQLGTSRTVSLPRGLPGCGWKVGRGEEAN